MSSIIDALKKSDKNRHAENDQNINQIKFGTKTPKNNRRGFWLLVILLLLVVSALFAWQQGWHQPVIGQMQSWFSSEQNAVNSDDHAATHSIENNQQLKEPITPATNQVNKLTPPKADDIKAISKSTEQAKSAAQIEHSNNQTTVKETLEVVNNRTGNQEVLEDTTTNQNKARTTKNTQPVIDDELVLKNNQPPTNKGKQVKPTLTQDYLLVHQIDFAIRKNIPDLKLNVHIYDPNPENRMVLINGVKFNSGEMIEDLVEIKEITKEGVVLRFETVEFLVPK